jgi:tetratricopeptide (TPR) repeat protein
MVRFLPRILSKLSLRAYVAIIALVVVGVAALVDWWTCVPADAMAQARYVGRDACIDCHAAEDRLWSGSDETPAWGGSDHYRAMAPATGRTVFADFADRRYEHFGVCSRMFRRGEKFFVRTDDRRGKLRDFEVKYVLGVRPLQQYLAEFPDGRVQCLPLAWDTEGRRWFHLYPNEPIPSTDELHWTRPLQNWNYMCAECHTTNLQKDYNPATDAYHTTWSEINVSCEACHGPGSLHVELSEARSLFWDRRVRFGLPNLKNPDSRIEIEMCAPCHARRRVVYPGFKPGDHFLDYYVPEMLESDLYWPDGQIREEDYEYGSFLQSRMYRKNVRCSNCHDPHSCTVKFKQDDRRHDKKVGANRLRDNQLCGQCHLPATYDTPRHHFHPDATKPGTLCVECHMAEATYMVDDPRRDHSLRIPRPELTVALGIPNACNAKGCHDNAAKGETPQWALDYVRKWYAPKKEPRHFAYAIDAGRKGKPDAEALLVEAARRTDLSPIVRASVIALLGRYPTPDAWAMVREGLGDPDGLVRVAAVRAVDMMTGGRGDNGEDVAAVAASLVPLLSDPVRAVRTEVARVLSRAPRDAWDAKDKAAFDKALAEYVAGQEFLGEQPAAHLNLGVIAANQGRPDDAERAYQRALHLDPNFVPARVNLALLCDQLGRKAEAEAELRRVIRSQPAWAEAHYYLGLLMGEDPKRLAEAARSLAKAAELAPENAKVHYNLALALVHLDRLDEAEREYLTANRLAPGDANVLRAMAVFYYQRKQWPKAIASAERLCQRLPDDAEAAALLSEIRRAAGE